MCCIRILRQLWTLLMPLEIFLLMARSFRLWVLVLFEIMVVRWCVLRVESLSFLCICCFQYEVWLLWYCPSIRLSFLKDKLVCLLVRVYSGKMGWRCSRLIVGGSSFGLVLGFLVVLKCFPRVERLRGLQLVWRLWYIRLVHSLHQKWVLRTYNIPFQLIWVDDWIAACADKCCRR